ncbi:unnamed protein product [Acanthosepion pharaonis]|uniref:Cilia- and flagella-associated protein 61 N-terminal domain-containing protein n=1 Tax=Acanthosepion pharaonis TaxID=158019 RepID=A0A812DEB3_ACAPH|nr:unnamed protein product [Sepia pharaonis]
MNYSLHLFADIDESRLMVLTMLVVVANTWDNIFPYFYFPASYPYFSSSTWVLAIGAHCSLLGQLLLGRVGTGLLVPLISSLLLSAPFLPGQFLLKCPAILHSQHLRHLQLTAKCPATPQDQHFRDATLADYFRPLKLKEDATVPKDYAIFATYRYEHSPVLYVRKARVEDNDDVTPLFNSMSETLKDKYGDYYVAELIEAQDEHMHCLVAEASKKAFFFFFLH